MAKDKISEEVQGFLTNMGLKVERIKETKEKTPDLSATDENGQKYLFEVKNLESNRLSSSNDISENELTVLSGAHAYDSTISGKIKHAFEQLKEYSISKESINIIWIVLQENVNNYLSNKIKRTLFGTKFISDSKLEFTMNCFYSERSDFFCFKETLDGVVISDYHRKELILNSCSDNYDKLKNSFLFNKFQYVFDPVNELKKVDTYLCLDPNETFKDCSAVLMRLKEKYELNNPRFFKMNHYEFIENKKDTSKNGK